MAWVLINYNTLLFCFTFPVYIKIGVIFCFCFKATFIEKKTDQKKNLLHSNSVYHNYAVGP